MNRAFLALAILAFALVAILGYGWVNQPPSNQELLANFAKATDYARAAADVHGWPWWSPSFMQGTSLAPAFGTAFTSLWIYLWSVPFGSFNGPKIAGLLCVFFASLTMFLFAKRLTKSNWAAFACGVIYLFLPGIFVRLAYVEHLNVVCAFVFLPLAFWGVLYLVETPCALSALACAAAVSALILAYVKIAILVVPVLILFALWVWSVRSHLRLPGVAILLSALGAIILLGILPNLPALREMRFMALFDLAPLQGWQHAFASKSALLWLDRDLIFTRDLPGDFNPTTARGGPYMGVIPVILFLILFLFRRNQIYKNDLGSLCRLFIGLALFSHWLSFGPRSVLQGHFEFLNSALKAPDLSIPIAWLVLAAQLWLLFTIPPRGLPGRNFFATIACFIYLLVPGFLLIEAVPFYSNIRAPHDFYQIVGIFCVAVSAGLAATLLLGNIKSRKNQFVIAVVGMALMSLDVSAYFRPFFTSPLKKEVFTHFMEAEDHLAKGKIPGRVFPCSGRYFYLLTPFLSGRGLNTEAFNNYLCQRGINNLSSAAIRMPADYHSFLNISGIAYVLIDKNDPDTPQDYQKFLREMLPADFENGDFVILKNENALAPAFVSSNFVQTSSEGVEVATCALSLSNYNLATIQTLPMPKNADGLAGQIIDKKIKMDEKLSSNIDYPVFKKSSLVGASHYNRFTIQPPSGKGWLIATEAYHPDWRAYSNGQSLEVHRAFEGLLGVYLKGGSSPVEFRFEQPWWYNLCAWLCSLSWLTYGVFSLFVVTPLCPNRLKRRLTTCSYYGNLRPDFVRKQNNCEKVIAPLVIIPTYNEADTLPGILDITLKVSPSIQILIIDDNSPDGTAALVEKHAEYGSRLHLLKRKSKLGLGSAYREGFQWAIERGFDACIEMDADFSHNPEDIPRLIDALNNGAHAAIGSRYVGGTRVIDWPEHRLLLSSGASSYVRILTGLPLADATSGFKAIQSEALKSLDWSQFKSEGYGFQIELHYFLWKAGFKVMEIPITFTERNCGQSKMTLTIAIEAICRVIQLASKGRLR